MLPSLIAMWMLSMPASYLAGDVYASRNPKVSSAFPWLCAVLTPLGAVAAIMTIIEVEDE